MLDLGRKTALVVGASGLIGKQVVSLLLENHGYSEVVVLVRKSTFPAHQKLIEVVFDFDSPDPSVVRGDDVFCCLGTTMKKAGSKESFRKVDYEYPLLVARLALKNGASQLLLVSALGAAANSLFFYNRVKGEVEQQLAQLNYPQFKIFRPSLLLGARNENRFGEKLGEVLFRVFKPVMVGAMKNYRAIDSAKVARAMVTLAQRKSSSMVTSYDSGFLQEF